MGLFEWRRGHEEPPAHFELLNGHEAEDGRWLEIHGAIFSFLGMGNGQSSSFVLQGEAAGRAALLRRRAVFARVQGPALVPVLLWDAFVPSFGKIAFLESLLLPHRADRASGSQVVAFVFDSGEVVRVRARQPAWRMHINSTHARGVTRAGPVVAVHSSPSGN
jgi:hypothetical protein